MEATHSTVPGGGAIHQFVTRAGDAFGVVVDHDGTRELVLYSAPESDTPSRTLSLDPEEADQLAETLHTRPLADRVTALERRIRRLTGSAA